MTKKINATIYTRLSASLLFDAEYYIEQFPIICSLDSDPLLHYLEHGEGDPHPCFSSSYYLAKYGDLIKDGQTPLDHYLANPLNNPHPLFDSEFYLGRLSEPLQESPLEHYLTNGLSSDLDPHPLFVSSEYKRSSDRPTNVTTLQDYLQSDEIIDTHELFDIRYYEDQLDKNTKETTTRYLLHYVLTGERQGLKPNEFFDPIYYWRQNRDVPRSKGALSHFVEFGWREKRDPSKGFSLVRYWRDHPDVSEEVNPLSHFLAYGQNEGRKIGGKYSDQTSNAAVVTKNEVYSAYELAEISPRFEPEVPLMHAPKIDSRLIAFYFPQFHPFPENNQFWGTGFTEWVNTTKAKPLFKHQYQPRLPGELGFYDTRLREVLVRQAEMVKAHGLHGLCLHHYFFDGRKVMRVPYNHLLDDADIDLNFCLHWANEPWTVRWDGLGNKGGVLLPQNHSDEDNQKFFEDIQPALLDKRYIRVDGRPLVVIYRPQLFPDIRRAIDMWRESAHKVGLSDLYLAVMQTGFEGKVDPRTVGFDAAIEYPPHNMRSIDARAEVSLFDKNFTGNIYSYPEMVRGAVNREQESYKLFRGVLPDWDCTPRRKNPDIYINSTPETFQFWVEEALKISRTQHEPEESLVFINAWNEWAEGAYLEPDRKFGYGYLNAVSRAITQHEQRTKLNKKIAVVLHLFYVDLAEEIAGYLSNVPMEFDLYVSVPENAEKDLVSKVFSQVGNLSGLEVVAVPNLGVDVAPFLIQFAKLLLDYDLVCKVHSKKSIHWEDHDVWRRYLFENLLGSKESIESIILSFEEKKNLGLVFPEHFPSLKKFLGWGNNFDYAKSLLAQLGIELHAEDHLEFPSGTMFWFRPEALRPLLELHPKLEQFDAEIIEYDGTLMHAVERTMLMICEGEGFAWEKVSHVKVQESCDWLSRKLSLTQMPKLALVSHIFHDDLLPELCHFFKNVPTKFDLYVSTRPVAVKSTREYLLKNFPGTYIEVRGVENRGRDMAPFAVEFADVYKRYEVVCWTHSKKSLYEPAYAGWRTHLLEGVLGSQFLVEEILNGFLKDPELGLVYGEPFSEVVEKIEWGSNEAQVRALLEKMDLDTQLPTTPEFPAGGMFWFRPSVLQPLFDLKLQLNDFEEEAQQLIDGSLAHAIERLPVLMAEKQGFSFRVMQTR